MTTGLFQCAGEWAAKQGDRWLRLPDFSVDALFEAENPSAWLARHLADTTTECEAPDPADPLAPPVESQETWATGGTCYRSRSARGEEAEKAGGDRFYDKVYTGSCAMGPALWVDDPPEPETAIEVEILRSGSQAFSGRTEINQIKRGFAELAGRLFRDNDFPFGAFLMTGTGIVPESDFTLRADDEVRIRIDGLGELRNTVATA